MLRFVPEQFSFPGLDPTPKDRLFFAIVPDNSAGLCAGKIAESLSDECGLTGAPLPLRRLHVSLHGLGDYAEFPAGLVAKACEAAAKVNEAPFEVAFDRAGSFIGSRRKRPLVLLGGVSLDPLIVFQRALGETMTRHGLGPWVSRRFTPHMTLLYDSRHVDTCPVEPVRWKVREFVLVHSLLRRRKHIPLARWVLKTGDADDGT